jgi:predicted nuclease of predicted toxin-antitoxin system
VRFLIDAQLPPRLARQLARLGHEASHVADIGLADALDEQVWQVAIERAAILVTKDHDFIVARAAVEKGPAVIWVRLGNTHNETLIARFTGALESMLAAIERGDTVVELVRHARP